MDRRKREEAKKGPALGPLGWTDVEKQERRRLERERRDGSGTEPCLWTRQPAGLAGQRHGAMAVVRGREDAALVTFGEDRFSG